MRPCFGNTLYVARPTTSETQAVPPSPTPTDATATRSTPRTNRVVLPGFKLKDLVKSEQKPPAYIGKAIATDSRNASFTTEDLVQAWRGFIRKIPHQNILHPVFHRTPDLEEDTHIIVHTYSQYEEDKLESLKGKLLAYLCDTLQNDQLRISTQLETLSAHDMLDTSRKRIKAIGENHPECKETLRNLFKELDLEFI